MIVGIFSVSERGAVCAERERECVCVLFKRETEHQCLRQPIHGIGRDPFHLRERERERERERVFN